MLRRDKSGKGGAGGEITLLLCWALSLTERVRLHLIKMQGCYVFLYIANITYRMNDDQHARVNTWECEGKKKDNKKKKRLSDLLAVNLYILNFGQ